MWYVYVIECTDSSLYTGVTNNLARRFQEHQAGKGGRYTNCNPPEKIIYSEEFSTSSEALNREKQIKGWTRAKKLALAQGNRILLKQL